MNKKKKKKKQLMDIDNNVVSTGIGGRVEESIEELNGDGEK